MAGLTVFSLASRSAASKATLLCFRGSLGGRKISAKIILPPTQLCIPGIKSRMVLHTSAVCQKDQLFEIPQNRKNGAQHWAIERAVAVGLLAFIPAGVFYPSPIVDYSLAVLLPMHAYWGINAIVSDYMWRPAVPSVKAIWLLTSILAGAGLLYLNLYDVGICKFTSMIMHL